MAMLPLQQSPNSTPPPPSLPDNYLNPISTHILHPRKPLKSYCSKFLALSMASLFLVALLSCIMFFSLSSAARRHRPSHSLIHQACSATRYPQTCKASLTASNRIPPGAAPLDVIQSALWLSIYYLKSAQSMVQDILEASAGNQNRTMAAKNCIEVLHYSGYRISSTMEALPRGKINDARAWMSAALHYQYACWSGLTFVNDTNQVTKTLSVFDYLLELSSNGLSMMASYENFGDDIGSWSPPKTEREGFWEPAGSGEGSELDFKGGVPTHLPPNATVCKAGDGCYRTVQQAVDAAPANSSNRKFVIRIREGVYEETVRVPLEKKNIVFLGDGMSKTVITGSSHVAPGISTYNTATVGVSGDGFMASGITFQNTAGPDAHQAVAFMSDSDLSVIERCEFLGNQDTLYAQSLRQLYKSCDIEGNIDFIFGNSASVFKDCRIQIRPRQLNPEKGESNAVTAQGRTDPAQTTGFVFENCSINGTDDYMKLYYSKPQVHKNFLGRPWKEYSRTVFIQCLLESLVAPQGWMEWIGDFALDTLYYGEFQNSGSGADLSARVTWSSLIPVQHINTYSVQNFIQGNEWIPTSSRFK